MVVLTHLEMRMEWEIDASISIGSEGLSKFSLISCQYNVLYKAEERGKVKGGKDVQ